MKTKRPKDILVLNVDIDQTFYFVCDSVLFNSQDIQIANNKVKCSLNYLKQILD